MKPKQHQILNYMYRQVLCNKSTKQNPQHSNQACTSVEQWACNKVLFYASCCYIFKLNEVEINKHIRHFMFKVWLLDITN